MHDTVKWLKNNYCTCMNWIVSSSFRISTLSLLQSFRKCIPNVWLYNSGRSILLDSTIIQKWKRKKDTLKYNIFIIVQQQVFITSNHSLVIYWCKMEWVSLNHVIIIRINILSMQINVKRFIFENKVLDPVNLSYSTWAASKFIFRRLITWYKLSCLLKYIK